MKKNSHFSNNHPLLFHLGDIKNNRIFFIYTLWWFMVVVLRKTNFKRKKKTIKLVSLLTIYICTGKTNGYLHKNRHSYGHSTKQQQKSREMKILLIFFHHWNLGFSFLFWSDKTNKTKLGITKEKKIPKLICYQVYKTFAINEYPRIIFFQIKSTSFNQIFSICFMTFSATTKTLIWTFFFIQSFTDKLTFWFARKKKC